MTPSTRSELEFNSRRVAHPPKRKYRAGSRTAKIAMVDIKIECMRLARRSAAKGAGKAGWRHVNESAVTAASSMSNQTAVRS